MIQIQKIQMSIMLGSFFGVRGVRATNRVVSIHGDSGAETVIPIIPFRGRSVQTKGVFGDFMDIEGSEYISGLSLQNIVEVEVSEIDDEEFNTRLLQITDAQGLSYTWRLFCCD